MSSGTSQFPSMPSISQHNYLLGYPPNLQQPRTASNPFKTPNTNHWLAVSAEPEVGLNPIPSVAHPARHGERMDSHTSTLNPDHTVLRHPAVLHSFTGANIGEIRDSRFIQHTTLLCCENASLAPARADSAEQSQPQSCRNNAGSFQLDLEGPQPLVGRNGAPGRTRTIISSCLSDDNPSVWLVMKVSMMFVVLLLLIHAAVSMFRLP